MPAGRGHLRWVLGREVLSPAVAEGDAAAPREPAFLAWLLEQETLPCEPVLPAHHRPSFWHRLLSFESLDERDDKLAH